MPAQAISSRAFQYALLSLSLLTLTATAPAAHDALRDLVDAGLSMKARAVAIDAPPEPQLRPAIDPLSTVAPFILSARDPAERAQAVRCLSDAVYYEAGYEPAAGQKAVAQVVLNRVRDRNFPNTVCGVVYQGWWRRTGCQFTFVCDGSLVRRPPTEEAARRARAVAEQALDGHVETSVGAATHYHTDYVSPYWRPTLVEVATIGAHIFYRWPGKAGEVTALTGAYAGGEVSYWRDAARRSPKRFGGAAT